MLVKYVRYGKLVTKPGFRNERLELEAEVPDGRDWKDVLDRLREEVNRELGDDMVRKERERAERIKGIVLKASGSLINIARDMTQELERGEGGDVNV